jgi:ankyrin repeat protein
MLNFKEWFIINESKEEKALASELAGDASVITALSTVIPQKDKNTLLLLAAYYYSKVKDIEQVKTDMNAYIGYLNRNKMPLISVDLVSKKPNPPWDDYLSWTEVIHTHQADDADKEKSKFKPSDIDFQGQVPILTGSDGKIRVYEANNPQQCIILGKGQSFCISQPGNKNWQSYRDRDTSTFYFVYDDTRPADDRLGIVVVDVRKNGIVLTDRPNNTGTTLDPYTGKLTNDSSSYMRYLREKGINISKIVNIPKSAEEQKEHEELGQTKNDFDWFKSLSPEYKSKYIGRGHLLTDAQFDYLWENKFTSLLTQYVKTGLLLNDHQIDKIASNRDLRDNYLHNRLIADQNSGNLSDKEYYLFSPKQKEIYYGNMNNDNKLKKAIKFNELGMVRYCVENGGKVTHSAVTTAINNNNLDIVTYLVENGGKVTHSAVTTAINNNNLDIVTYLVEKIEEKGGKITGEAVTTAIKRGYLNIVKYLVGKGGKITDEAFESTFHGDDLALVKYLMENGGKITDSAVQSAIYGGNLDIVKYLVENGGKITDKAVTAAINFGNLDIVKCLVEKGGKITDKAFQSAVYGALIDKNLDLVKYLVEKGAKINDQEVLNAILRGNSDLVTYLVEKGGKITDDAFQSAVYGGDLDLVKYLVGKGATIDGAAVQSAVYGGNLDVVNYLKSVMEKQ